MATFASDLSRMVKEIMNETSVAAREPLFELFSAVIISSPVKTGRFRANWGMGYSAESAPNAGTQTDKSGASTINRIRGDLDAITKFQNPVFFTNNMPYAIALEDGSSAQAPNGMVAKNIAIIKSRYGNNV